MSTLSQRLRPRHVNMIAIGGSIGTGIFLASGYSISAAGPGGALLAYGLMAVIVYFLMSCLGEMSAHRPTAGTFCEYSTEYVGKSFGFAMGYNYWLNWAITIAAEISAASLIVSYWFPGINSIIFSSIFLIAIFLCNIYSVKIYGEVEYALSFIKVSAIIAFIVLGIAAVCHTPSWGMANWHVEDAPFHKGWSGFILVFLFAGFSFQGTELVAVASGETKNPETVIPNSIKLVFWRLILFYVLTIGIITLLIPFNDVHLTYQDSVAMSPYTLIFSKYFPHYAANIINFVALIAVLSAANASMYSATRILFNLAERKQAPPIFKKINSFGIPITALLATTLIGSLIFLSSFIGNGAAFSYLVQISSLSGFVAWFGIAVSYLKFRKQHVKDVNQLKYRAKFYPYAPLFALVALLFIMLAQFIPVIQGDSYKPMDFVITYSSILVFLAFYFIHKFHTKIINKTERSYAFQLQ